jgi:hypothetical protein
MTVVVWLIGGFIAFCLVMRRVGSREQKREACQQQQAKEIDEKLKKETLASANKLSELASKYKH